MVECKVNIVEAFELDYYPGWCKAVLIDFEGVAHVLVDKLPVIGLEYDEISNLPMEKYIRVEIDKDLDDKVEINTGIPDGIETEEGETHFIVAKKMIKRV